MAALHPRHDRIRKHKVQHYTARIDQAGFVADHLTYDATLRNLELIGETATHIPDHVRRAYPGVPWRLIIATRNCLIHAYLGIDDDTLWSIVTDDIPNLLAALRKVANDPADE